MTTMDTSSPLADICNVYRQDGFAVVRGALTGKVLARYVDAWTAFAASIDGRREIDGGKTQIWEFPDDLDRMIHEPALVTVATNLLGPDVCVYLRRILVKDTTYSGQVETHQDAAYSFGNPDKLLCMVALSSCGPDNGGLWYVKGSHRFGLLGQGTIDPERFPPMETVCPVLEPGDVLLAHSYAWHRSEPSRNMAPRVMFNIFYQSASDGNFTSRRAEGRPPLVAGQWRTDHFWNRRLAGKIFRE